MQNLDIYMNQASTVDELVAQYNDGLRSIIDKHAPLREKVVVLRPSAPWFTSEAHTLRRKLRKAERLWRKRRLQVDLDCYTQLLREFSQFLKMEKRTFYNNKVLEYGGDKRALFRLVDNLAGKEKSPILPKRSTPQDVAADV